MYQALYRKYRPKDFDSVVGQNAIVTTLRNSIVHHNFSHAYMFFGPRGTGKTTISKIFARNINCLNSKDGLACGKCEHCKISFERDCVDIIEIDAASNNGVDEIRELRNKISLIPSELQYKVYIIDEVHMLSIGAFNALLKTLEEPPEHAVFILATTDPQKVPETIVSRCQCFSFKKISPDVIEKKIESICKEEKIKIDDEVINNIAISSDGGLRDALSLLDKLVSYTDKKITISDFEEVNGTISTQQLSDFLENVLSGNVSEVLNTIQLFDESGKNLIQIFSQLLFYCRNLLVDYYLYYKKTSFSIDLLQKFTNSINEKMIDIKKSDNTRIYIEMFFLKFIHDNITNSKEIYIEKPSEAMEEKVVEKNISKPTIEEEPILEVKVEEKKQEEPVVEEVKEEKKSSKKSKETKKEEIEPTEDDSEKPKVLNIQDIMKVRVHNTFALADKALLKDELQLFEKFKDYTFDQDFGYLVCSLLDSTVRVVSQDSVVLSYEYDSNVTQNLDDIDKLSKVYQDITKTNKKLAIISDEEWNNVKDEFIKKYRSGEKYEVLEEPKPVFEEIKKNDIIGNSAVDLFGDIVEIE